MKEFLNQVLKELHAIPLSEAVAYNKAVGGAITLCEKAIIDSKATVEALEAAHGIFPETSPLFSELSLKVERFEKMKGHLQEAARNRPFGITWDEIDRRQGGKLKPL